MFNIKDFSTREKFELASIQFVTKHVKNFDFLKDNDDVSEYNKCQLIGINRKIIEAINIEEIKEMSLSSDYKALLNIYSKEYRKKVVPIEILKTMIIFMYKDEVDDPELKDIVIKEVNKIILQERHTLHLQKVAIFLYLMDSNITLLNYRNLNTPNIYHYINSLKEKDAIDVFLNFFLTIEQKKAFYRDFYNSNTYYKNPEKYKNLINVMESKFILYINDKHTDIQDAISVMSVNTDLFRKCNRIEEVRKLIEEYNGSYGNKILWMFVTNSNQQIDFINYIISLGIKIPLKLYTDILFNYKSRDNRKELLKFCNLGEFLDEKFYEENYTDIK